VTRNAIEIHDLHRSFGTVRAVDGLDLTIGKGESVAVLGPNGAGKSTTIAMLLGLLAPDAGSVAVWGMPPAEAVARGHIAAMLQEGGLMPGVTVAELVGFVRGLYPDPLPLDRVLEAAGPASLAGRRVDKLSGGQTQRVRFALALAGNPSVLVLDEPTSGMDVESRRAFWTSMRAEAAAGRTVLFATHYLEEADDNADHIVVVNGGRIVADGPATEIKAAAGGPDHPLLARRRPLGRPGGPPRRDGRRDPRRQRPAAQRRSRRHPAGAVPGQGRSPGHRGHRRRA